MVRTKLSILAATALLALAPASSRADDTAARTADLYKRFTYKNVTSTEADRIFSDQKISSTFNPRNKMANPDPQWLPGWDALQLTDETKTAILQAAINRTWMVQVHRDYQRYRAAWQAIDKQFRPELEQIMARTGYQARAADLAKLYETVLKKAEADNVLYPIGSAPAHLGFVNDLLRAIVEVHKQTKTEFLLGSYLKRRGLDLAKVRTTARPFATDAVERELFTAFSQAKGNLDTPPLPMMSEYGRAFAAVKWPTVKNAADAMRAGQALVATNAPALTATTMARVPSLFSGEGDDPADPKLRWIAGGGEHGPLTIKKVTRKGAAMAIELLSKEQKSVPYNCKLTYRLDSFGDRVRDCKYKQVITNHVMQVTASELPPDVELAAADTVELYGDVVSKKQAKGRVDYVVEVRAFAKIERAGKVLASQP